MQDFVHRPFATQPFPDDGEQDVDADGDPDLGLHGVLGVAVEAFDAEVLLDPFEEEFDSPTGAIELGDGEGGEVEVVGEEDESAAVFVVVEGDASERFGVELRRARPGENDGLIAAESGGLVDGSAVPACDVEVGFGPGDEEGFGELKAMEPGEVDVGAVHDIDGSGFDGKVIEHGDVVRFALGNVDGAGDAAAKVEQGVKFDGPLRRRNFAQGKRARQRSMVVESRA